MTMLRCKKWIVLFIFTIFFTTLALSSVSEAAVKLKDLREAAWAEQSIAEMHAYGIISGYPGGTFKPYNNVSRLEALAMLIRVLGKEEQAKALENTKVDYKMPPDLYWGKGYLIMGVQMGMLNRDYLHLLQPASPASRVEVAVLVYHALKLRPDNSGLTFADVDKIPQEYRECVAAVVKNNIMMGYPGNLFMPNDNINRAQMAVLVSRLVDNKFANLYPELRLPGKLQLLNKASRVLTVQLANGASLSRPFAVDCDIYLDGKRVDANALTAGDEVKLVLNNNGQVVFIRAERLKTMGDNYYKGRVDSLFAVGNETWLTVTDFNGVKRTRPVAANVSFQPVKEGSYVEIVLADNKIIKLNILQTTSFKGTVTSVRQSLLSVRDSGGTLRELSVTGDVAVFFNNSKLTYSAVKKNDRVEVAVYDGRVIYINILLTGHLEGKIVELDTTGTYGITIKNDDGDEIDYEVISSVKVERNEREIDFYDLKIGDQVRLELNSRDRVMGIKVLAEAFSIKAGKVIELTSDSSKPFIRIEGSDDRKLQYNIASKATYFRDDEDIKLTDIVIGSEVEIRLEDGKAKRINVTNDENITLEGEVTSVSTSRNRVTIEQINGNRFSYDLVSSPILRDRNGTNIYLNDVKVGWEVELVLKNGKVSKLTRR